MFRNGCCDNDLLPTRFWPSKPRSTHPSLTRPLSIRPREGRAKSANLNSRTTTATRKACSRHLTATGAALATHCRTSKQFGRLLHARVQKRSGAACSSPFPTPRRNKFSACCVGFLCVSVQLTARLPVLGHVRRCNTLQSSSCSTQGD